MRAYIINTNQMTEERKVLVMLVRRKEPPKLSVYRPKVVKFPNKQRQQKEHQTDPWVEYWNLQPGLQTHRAGTKTYMNGAKACRQLLTGLTPRRWDVGWVTKNRINERFLYEPWPPQQVKRAMRLLSAMTEPGNWPGPATWLSRLNLPTAVYNPRSCTSMLVFARCQKAPKRLYAHQDEVSWENASPQAQTVAEPMRAAGVVVWVSVAEGVARHYGELCRENPLITHISGGLEGFGRMLARWLQEQNIDKPGKMIAPPNGVLWKRFIATFGAPGEF